MPNVAVLTNDMQYEFSHKISTSKDGLSKELSNFNEFLSAVRTLGQLVVHLQLINDPSDPQVQRRFRGRNIPAIRGTDGVQMIKELVHPSDLVMEKGRDSGFYETKVDDKLTELGVKTVIVTGLQTQICVQTTAADAFFRGYKVWVPEECVFSPKEEDKLRSFEWMSAYCAVVAPVSEILARLRKEGDLPSREEMAAA
jgi:nicotinamidase-related amidase